MTGAAAWTLLLLQPAAASSNSSAPKPSHPFRRFESVLAVVSISILILKKYLLTPKLPNAE
jgi:hypothetical protein